MKEKYKFCNLYVKGLPDNITEDEFRKIFWKFRSNKISKTVKKELYQSYLGIKRSLKVSGFICFESSESAKNAKDQLNNTFIRNNLKLFVNFFQSKAERAEFLKISLFSNKNNNNQMFDPKLMPMERIIFFNS
jgi:polyadenylate-binding protein